MSLLRTYTWSLAGLLCLACWAPARADAPAAKETPKGAAAKKTEAPRNPSSKFVRIKRDAKEQPVALETATVRYVSADGKKDVTVDLIGVVHIGERDYYQKLNKQMEQYDVLLYELVAPQGTRVPKGGRKGGSSNPLSMMQGMMKSMLNLESQLEHIDYTRKNFVHADMSPDDMARAMEKRGETGFTLFLSVFADMMRQQNTQMQKKAGKKGEDVDLLSLFFDPQASLKLKRVMAEQLEAMEGPNGGLGPTLNNLLVVDRNKAALKVLEKELARGRKKIGIFYGAAHMPDFEQRLVSEFGLRRDSDRWLRAWDMEMRNSPPAPGGVLGDLLKSLGQ